MIHIVYSRIKCNVDIFINNLIYTRIIKLKYKRLINKKTVEYFLNVLVVCIRFQGLLYLLEVALF